MRARAWEDGDEKERKSDTGEAEKDDPTRVHLPFVRLPRPTTNTLSIIRDLSSGPRVARMKRRKKRKRTVPTPRVEENRATGRKYSGSFVAGLVVSDVIYTYLSIYRVYRRGGGFSISRLRETSIGPHE